MPDSPIPLGLYEHILSNELMECLSKLPTGQVDVEIQQLRDKDDPTNFEQHLAKVLRRAFSIVRGSEERRHLANRLIEVLESDVHGVDLGDRVAQSAILKSVLPKGSRSLARPATPLSQPVLLTGSHGEPELGSELRKELESSDSVDLLVSFITWTGWLQMAASFKAFADRGGKLRLITTTYMGNTDARAVRELARLPGASVLISLDPRRTRLHAKAWLFHRATGLHSAYIGSANLSKAALGSGIEWTLKITQIESSHMLEKFRATFDALWLDGEFERVDPENRDQFDRLCRALLNESGGGSGDGREISLNLHPYPFQQEILDDLTSEREEFGRFRNLVVAATGTGKTVIAALDYARHVTDRQKLPRLLFVAHREEILRQARTAFRSALHEGNFGEMLVGGQEPTSWDHVFASIQSLSSRSPWQSGLAPDHWDMVIVDEFHHAAAPTYRKLLEWVKPRILLGLTATPERSDNWDLTDDFDGHIAASIRLWDALNLQLLTPFIYYAIADNMSLEDIPWERGGYRRSDLDLRYRQDSQRARLIATKFAELSPDWTKARALGFCVSVDHARLMCEIFNSAGIASAFLSGESGTEERRQSVGNLRRGDLRVIFTCDLFNEGIDIPEVDTLLFLRPTDSATVFQQQLGRGLRLCVGKDQVLVLDFVGRANRKFRFDQPLRVLTNLPRNALIHAVESQSFLAPRGCSILLERQAREDILDNLRQNLVFNRSRLEKDLRAFLLDGNPPQLDRFLEATGATLEDIYSKGKGWQSLLKSVPFEAREPDSEIPVEKWSESLELLLHCDDRSLLTTWKRFIAGEAPANFSSVEHRQILMLHHQWLGGAKTSPFSLDHFQSQIFRCQFLKEEMESLFGVLLQRAPADHHPLPLEGVPLHLHRHYRRREILGAVGRWTESAFPPWREGVLWMRDEHLDVFLVTLEKDEKKFSPSTRYEDRAISMDRFHWKTQNSTRDDSEIGSRYQSIGSGQNRGILFVRENERVPFLFVGEVTYLQHEGSRPMGIDWRLKVPMPARDFGQWASILAA
jgi:superfamily II DNA or RNA helicase/HKD family nuclease